VNGLVHLHMPIESHNGKPALAHCDLKSKNILVKSDLTCCIGDLGLALSGDQEGRVIMPLNTIRTGTKRYMAPEILSKKIDYRYLDAFQKAEMYSLALIFWELLRRCSFELNSIQYTSEYKPPYFEYTLDPDEEQMENIVCTMKQRPSIMDKWREVPVMSQFTNLVEELWVDKPNARLNSLRVKKSLIQIIKKQ
jgi:serine/threonine protein kinase